MTSAENPTPRNLTARCLLALGLIGALALINYLALRAEIQANESSVALLNLSGRQRMLLQHTALLAQELITTNDAAERQRLRQELLKNVEPLEKAHHRLLEWGPAGAEGPPPEVREIYENAPWTLDVEVRNYIAHLRDLAKSDPAELTLQNAHHKYIRDVALSQRVIDGLDAVVAAYQTQNQSKMAQLRRTAHWSVASTAAVLLLTGLFVFRPMVRRVHREMHALQELNETLEQRVAERTATAEQRARELEFSESALRSQTRILRSILDSMGDGVIVADRENEFLLLNPAMREMLNIRPGDPRPDVWSENWTQPFGVSLFLPDRRTPYPQDRFPLTRAMNGEPVDRAEVFLRRSARNPDRPPCEGGPQGVAKLNSVVPAPPSPPFRKGGSKERGEGMWLSVTARPLVDEDSAVHGGVAVIRDITQRKRSEQELRDSEALYHSLVDNLPLSVIRKDLDGRFTFVNELVGELMGKAFDELVGHTDFDLYPHELAEKYRRDDQWVIETGQVFEDVEEHITPTGKRMYVEVRKTAIHDSSGNAVGTQIIFWDVTARELAEQERREMQVVLENAVEGICRLNRDGHYLAVNKAYADMLGYSSQELIGRPWLEIVHRADQPQVTNAYQQMRARGKGEVEARIVRSDDTVFFAELLMVKARDHQGHFDGLYCFTKDISERKVAEEKIVQSERLAAIGQMVAGVAHESRNALQQIQACTNMLEWKVNGNTEAGELLGDLQQAQDRLHRLFDELRSYASPLRLDRRLVNVSQVVRQAWDAVAVVCVREASLREHAEDVDRQISADAFQLEQVFRNLFENSLAACEGPAVIDVVYKDVRLHGEPALRIAVRDNGPGLSAESKAKLFEPFYTTKTRGTGLGSAIAKRIVEAHGGRIEVGDGVEPGTEILITLPRGESS